MVAAMPIRSERLRTLLGVDPDGLTASHVEELVRDEVEESFDLEFKGELYGNSDQAKRDLAGDVAALANAAGGIIVIGVAEVNGRAASCPGVQVGDAEIRRMRQIVANGVSPVSDFDITSIPGVRHLSGLCFIVIEVPQRPLRPHGVAVNDGYRYPKRSGPMIRYLSEPEVAEAYRQRDFRSQSRLRRLDDVWTDGLSRLNSQEEVYVAVAVVPEIPGDFIIDQAAFSAVQTSLTGGELTVVPVTRSASRTRIGIGRVSVDGGYDKPSVRYTALDMHSDGSAFYALRGCRTGAATNTNLLGIDRVLIGLLSGLLQGAQHAVKRSMASGQALIRATIYKPDQLRPVQLSADVSGWGDPTGVVVDQSLEPVTVTVPLDSIVNPGPRAAVVTARLLHQIGHAFGVAELGQLTPDGRLRRQYLDGGTRQALLDWAERSGVEVTDELL